MLAEDVGQLEEGGVDEDGEGVPLEESREADDGLALNSEYIMSYTFRSIVFPNFQLGPNGLNTGTHMYFEFAYPCSPRRPHMRLLVSSAWAALASMEDGSNEFICCEDTDETGADDGGGMTGAPGIGGGGGGTEPPAATT